MERWVLIRTRGAQEETAQRQLAERGFHCYLPLLTRRVRKHGRRIRCTVPLFPQYLFLQLRIGEQSLLTVRAPRAVLGVVRFGERYAVVPAEVVRFLQSRERTVEEPPRFLPNGRVRVLAGPCAGLEGVFVAESGWDRVLILLDMLGQKTPVRIPEVAVEPLCP